MLTFEDKLVITNKNTLQKAAGCFTLRYCGDTVKAKLHISYFILEYSFLFSNVQIDTKIDLESQQVIEIILVCFFSG